MDTVVAEVIGDIALVVVASSLFGAVARRCGQPAVIGQILAGPMLRPSLLGRLPGHLTGRLFSHQVLPYLTVLAQVAVVIFMFSVGYEIEFRSVRGHGRAVPLVAAAALLVPMSLGIACVLLLRPDLATMGERSSGHSFVLFMGVATSITALPVLAAIVRERSLAGTTAGVIATAAAGIMDVAAWLVLAAALVGTSSSGKLPWLTTVLVTSGFVAVMLLAVRPGLSCWMGRSQSVMSSPVLTILVLMALITTLMTGPLLSQIRPSRAERPTAAERLTNT